MKRLALIIVAVGLMFASCSTSQNTDSARDTTSRDTGMVDTSAVDTARMDSVIRQ